MFIHQGMNDKGDVVCTDTHTHIYNEILLSHKKEGNAICSNMDEPGDYQIKWSKSDIEKDIIWYHLFVEPEKMI